MSNEETMKRRKHGPVTERIYEHRQIVISANGPTPMEDISMYFAEGWWIDDKIIFQNVAILILTRCVNKESKDNG